MNFRIADTFTASLQRLRDDHQKAVKTTAFDMQLNPESPGLSYHKLEKARDKNFWSVRVSQDIRIIVHRTKADVLLCYVDHHDKAYDWAARRKLETHPTTGAAQLVEVRETVQELYLAPEPSPSDRAFESSAEPPAPPSIRPTAKPRRVLAHVNDSELLKYGVPSEWLADVKEATEESLFSLAAHLPAEAAEALLQLATGGVPRPIEPALSDANPFEHPDALRRFRLMSNADELRLALDYPWEKWTIFLHPDQEETVRRNYGGAARVAGSAGTGKTIVALHRAVHLARQNVDGRILLTTYSDALANALQTKLKRLLGTEPQLAERIDVASLLAMGLRLHRSLVGPVTLASRDDVVELVTRATKAVSDHGLAASFVVSEWTHVIDARQVNSWEAYRDVVRLGRKTRIPEAKRRLIWDIVVIVRAELAARKLATEATMFGAVSAAIAGNKNPPFEFVVVDEAQDLSEAHVRFLASIGDNRPNALFFAGDMGQRIFQQPFSWKGLGVDIRGRSRTLRVNYRTSHQIRSQADRLLPVAFTDVDENAEKRSDTVSAFDGPEPLIRVTPSESGEIEVVSQWLSERTGEGMLPHELAVFVRSEAQFGRAKAALTAAAIPCKVLDATLATASGYASICTMHLAKGLEFRAVVVMACDEEVIPQRERLENVGDGGDLRETYDTERQLLYVACTRARDHLLVSGVAPGSEFLDDLTSERKAK
jgi:superfamily I DNA/RNA helicase/mRNA-degrading endonuclease RelE of RelBE toxin-antitoxin system